MEKIVGHGRIQIKDAGRYGSAEGGDHTVFWRVRRVTGGYSCDLFLYQEDRQVVFRGAPIELFLSFIAQLFE